jgi:hypothetical protein
VTHINDDGMSDLRAELRKLMDNVLPQVEIRELQPGRS